VIVLALQIVAAAVTLLAHAAVATHYVLKSRDHATRAGLASGLAIRSAKSAEEAAGIARWEKWPDAG
jgi:hypothetical protein